MLFSFSMENALPSQVSQVCYYPNLQVGKGGLPSLVFRLVSSREEESCNQAKARTRT